MNKARQIGNKKLLLKQQIWNVIIQNSDLKSKMVKSYKIIYEKYPLRLVDGFLVFGLIGFYTFCTILWKNLYTESERTLYPFNPHKFRFMCFFPGLYLRQPTDPFIYKPEDSNFREAEMHSEYQNYKDKILFRKLQQADVIRRCHHFRIAACFDHRELDITDYQNLVKINYDKNALIIIKKAMNNQLCNAGIIKDNLLYIKEQLDMEYKISDYKFKDDLYKELNELINI